MSRGKEKIWNNVELHLCIFNFTFTQRCFQGVDHLVKGQNYFPSNEIFLRNSLIKGELVVIKIMLIMIFTIRMRWLECEFYNCDDYHEDIDLCSKNWSLGYGLGNMTTTSTVRVSRPCQALSCALHHHHEAQAGWTKWNVTDRHPIKIYWHLYWLLGEDVCAITFRRAGRCWGHRADH